MNAPFGGSGLGQQQQSSFGQGTTPFGSSVQQPNAFGMSGAGGGGFSATGAGGVLNGSSRNNSAAAAAKDAAVTAGALKMVQTKGLKS
jgi:hypothetical protein